MSELIKKIEIFDIGEYQEKPDFNNTFVLELELDTKEKIIYTLDKKEKELYNQGFGPEQLMKITNVGLSNTYIVNYGKQ